MSEDTMLDLESGWFIECWRCSNHDFISDASYISARDALVKAGWRMVDDFQMCPQCLGVTACHQTTPEGTHA